jgi:hypothetical protein
MSDSEYDSDSETDGRDTWLHYGRQAMQPRIIETVESFESGLNANNQLQPTSLQFQQIQTIQVVTIDSLHRDQQVYPNPLSCRLMLPKAYKNISRIDIVQIKMLNGLYALTAVKGNTTLSLYDASENLISVTIPDGTYTTTTLSTVLTTMLNAMSSIKYKMTYSTSIGRFILTAPGNPFRLPFLSFQTDPTQKVYTDWGLGYILGFGGPPQDLSASETHIATMMPRLNTDYIYLKLNETENMNTVDTTGPENFAISQDSNGLTQAYFGKLLLNDFGSYAQTFMEAPKLFQNPLSRLDRISFEWVDKMGNPLIGPDALSCDWHITLRIFQITDGPTDSSTLIRTI